MLFYLTVLVHPEGDGFRHVSPYQLECELWSEGAYTGYPCHQRATPKHSSLHSIAYLFMKVWDLEMAVIFGLEMSPRVAVSVIQRPKVFIRGLLDRTSHTVSC